jgi:hypothetical protein
VLDFAEPFVSVSSVFVQLSPRTFVGSQNAVCLEVALQYQDTPDCSSEKQLRHRWTRLNDTAGTLPWTLGRSVHATRVVLQPSCKLDIADLQILGHDLGTSQVAVPLDLIALANFRGEFRGAASSVESETGGGRTDDHSLNVAATHDASNVVDIAGTSTFYSSADDDDAPRLTIDLGRDYVITSMLVFARLDRFSGRPLGASVAWQNSLGTTASLTRLSDSNFVSMGKSLLDSREGHEGEEAGYWWLDDPVSASPCAQLQGEAPAAKAQKAGKGNRRLRSPSSVSLSLPPPALLWSSVARCSLFEPAMPIPGALWAQRIVLQPGARHIRLLRIGVHASAFAFDAVLSADKDGHPDALHPLVFATVPADSSPESKEEDVVIPLSLSVAGPSSVWLILRPSASLQALVPLLSAASDCNDLSAGNEAQHGLAHSANAGQTWSFVSQRLMKLNVEGERAA